MFSSRCSCRRIPPPLGRGGSYVMAHVLFQVFMPSIPPPLLVGGGHTVMTHVLLQLPFPAQCLFSCHIPPSSWVGGVTRFYSHLCNPFLLCHCYIWPIPTKQGFHCYWILRESWGNLYMLNVIKFITITFCQ